MVFHPGFANDMANSNAVAPEVVQKARETSVHVFGANQGHALLSGEAFVVCWHESTVSARST